ncbi:hypothetical protein D7252_01235 [Microbacterium sp. CGR2]|nr:hypothetical protein D7252_01235 [Microbacterium sp. CGR2]
MSLSRESTGSPLTGSAPAAAGYLVGVVVPSSLVAQLTGSVLYGRSWPGGTRGWLVGVIAFVAVGLASAALTKQGKAPHHRLLGLQKSSLKQNAQ